MLIKSRLEILKILAINLLVNFKDIANKNIYKICIIFRRNYNKMKFIFIEYSDI